LNAVFGFTDLPRPVRRHDAGSGVLSLGPGVGGQLFAWLHCALFLGIWILVPLVAADSISRERREGTLPLLFLTPLKAHDIVTAKGMAHGLRAFSLWLAVLPVLTICFVAGGLAWPQVLLSVFINLSSLCLAMAAALTASARSRDTTRALALAVCFAALFLYLFCLAAAHLFASGIAPKLRGPFFQTDVAPAAGLGCAFAVNWDGFWQLVLSLSRSGPGPVVAYVAVLPGLSLLALVLAVRFAAWNVSRSWQQLPDSPQTAWLKRKLFTPVFFQSFLRRWLRWELAHNPIGWLERRSWSGRLVVWSWFAVVTCIYSSLFIHLDLYERGFSSIQAVLGNLLALTIALTAANSFRRERNSGVLELLLVAPLTKYEILSGRLRGIWGQFLPAIALLLAVWLYLASFLSPQNQWPAVLLYTSTFATLPVVGLYFSLAKSSFFAALVWTLLTQIAVPAGMVRLTHLFVYLPGSGGAFPIFIAIAAQIALALGLGWRLERNLRYRRFAFLGK